MNCARYFHGYNCLGLYCTFYEDKLYCLECFKSLCEENKKPSHTKTVKFNHLDRKFFLRYNFNFYSYYPQLDDQVYFILQAYEEYLKKFYHTIIFETEEIFFWKNTINTKFDPYSPFLCEIMKMEYAFPNQDTINLMKTLFKNQTSDCAKLLIKIQLRIKDLDKSAGLGLGVTNKTLDIVFFENDLPDFLVHSETYNQNLKIYKNLKINQNLKLFNKQNAEFRLVLGEEIYDIRFLSVIFF